MKYRVTLLQMIDSTYRGGAQKVVLEIVRSFPKLNHIVCYWAGTGDLESEFELAGAELVKIPFDGMMSLRHSIRFVKRLVRERNVDIIHTHMFTPNMIASAIRGRSLRKIRTYHGECFDQRGLKGWAMRMMERRTIGAADAVVAVSGHVAHYIQDKLGVRVPAQVVYNFGNGTPVRRLVFSHTPVRFVATSNNQHYKNYPLLLDAFARVQHLPVALDIYGKGMEPLIERVRDQGISNITFKGSVGDVTQILPDYDVYVATSHSGEGFSLSLLEAMNAGLAIVCSDIPQFKEAAEGCALLFHSGNVDDLVNKISALAADHELIISLSEKSIQRGASFTRDRFIREMADVYGLN